VEHPVEVPGIRLVDEHGDVPQVGHGRIVALGLFSNSSASNR